MPGLIQTKLFKVWDMSLTPTKMELKIVHAGDKQTWHGIVEVVAAMLLGTNLPNAPYTMWRRSLRRFALLRFLTTSN
jgi:hypothetical protein